MPGLQLRQAFVWHEAVSASFVKFFRIKRSVDPPRPGISPCLYRIFCLDQIGMYLPAGIKRSVIPNPIDLEKLPPSSPEKSDRFVGVGRLSPEKGFADFARAAQRASVAATIIGAGESREEILAANPAMELPGWLNHADMLNRLRKARGPGLSVTVARNIGAFAARGCRAGDIIGDQQQYRGAGEWNSPRRRKWASFRRRRCRSTVRSV